MTRHDHDELDAEDLLARGRRGLLSSAEQEALAQALQAQPELAAAYRVGVALDRAGAVQGGDEALIARAADAALARAEMLTRRPSVRAPARVGTRLAIAAALLLSMISATGIATALWTGAVVWPFAAPWPASSAPTAAAPARPTKPARQRRAATPPAVVAAPVGQPVLAEPAEPELPVLQPSASGRSTPADPAAQASALFHAANSARRAGEQARARRLYARLIDAHPASDEAGLARVSLGRLLLAAGDARGAEREFRLYLRAGGGQLGEEALVGQAQSLGRLRRADAERQAWQRLLAANPTSIYAAQAKQRLAALDAAVHEAPPPEPAPHEAPR
jgi:TolA-binding protein